MYTLEYLSFGNETSPYRSNAYLGLPTPEFAMPKHFHLPKGLNKFVPIRRSKSLTEVFSNEKYSNLLDNSPLILPYAGRMAPAKKLQKKLFYDAPEEETDNPFNSFDDTDLQLEISSLHCNLLKVVDEKIEKIRSIPTSETFVQRISSMDYDTESPLNKEENNNNNSLGNLNNDIPKNNVRKTFERLNKLEQAIIIELEQGKLDRSEGTIFHKIEHEIKHKNQSEDNYKKWDCLDTTIEKRDIKSSTPYASKIPVFRPATVPKINFSKFKTIQKIKPKNVLTRIRKSQLTHDMEKSNVIKNGSGLKTNHSAIFGKNPFTTDENLRAFKLKEKGNASSLWHPFEKKSSSTCSSRHNSVTATGSCTISDFVEHQTNNISDLGNCQKRMKEDIEEILLIHEKIHCKPKSKTFNK